MYFSFRFRAKMITSTLKVYILALAIRFAVSRRIISLLLRMAGIFRSIRR